MLHVCYLISSILLFVYNITSIVTCKASVIEHSFIEVIVNMQSRFFCKQN